MFSSNFEICYKKYNYMRALVISGGGSKGAFAGGVAQYLIEIEKQIYGKPKQEWINIIHAAIKNL